MPFHAIQPTFAGGEFAPSLHSRVDLQKYGTGLKRARNFIIHPHGGASNRPGTKLVREVKYSNRKTRIIEFEFSVTQAYAIEFGHLYVRFHLNGGTMMDSGVPYEVTTPFSEDDLESLKFAQSADVLYVVHPDHPPTMLIRYADNPPLWQLETFQFENGPFMTSNIDTSRKLTCSGTAKGAAITLTSTVDLFTANHINALFRIRHSVEGQAAHSEFSATGQGSTIKCGDTWRIITHGSWGGKIQIEKSIDNGASWSMLRQFTSKWGLQSDGVTYGGDYNANTYGTDEGTFLLRINCTELTNGTCIVDLSSDPFEQTGVVKVSGYTNAKTVSASVLTEVGKNTATMDWAEGSWSVVRGFPSTVTFTPDDRLAFSCTYAEPQTTWMSKTGAYSDFGRSTPLEDTDGITANLPSRRVNGINALVALQEILALTSASEWVIGSTNGTAMTPTTVSPRPQGYRGSSTVEPVVVGNRIVYIQPMGSVVRDLGYNYEANGYSGDDLSVFANHLFSGYNIVEMAYQQEPDSIVWCVRSDGKLLGLTYNREHEVIAWTWHDTDGSVESICSIPADGFNEIWLIVRRGTKRFVERMVKRMASTDVKDQFFVDCGITYDSPKTITGATKVSPVVITSVGHGLSNGDLVDIDDVLVLNTSGNETDSELNGGRFRIANVTTNTFELTDEETGANIDGSGFLTYSSGGKARKAVTTLAGFDHLEGKTVSILADGNVMTPQVVTGGEITLEVAASRVHAGLGFVSDLQTLNIELRLEDGTAQDRMLKVPEVTMRFLNSGGGWVGPDENSLVELSQRTAEALGTPIELFSGDHVETLNSEYERGTSVFFRQIDPLPVTLLAIMPKVTPGG